jgi:hypothetical protein
MRRIPNSAIPFREMDEEQDDNNPASKSYREIQRRDLEIIVPEETVNERARRRRERALTPNLDQL